MLYGELGVIKIDITVKCRMISFRLKLATDDDENKFSVKIQIALTTHYIL